MPYLAIVPTASVIQCSQKRGSELSEDVQKIHPGFEIECKKIWSPSRVRIFFGHCCFASSLNIAVSAIALRNDNLFDSLDVLLTVHLGITLANDQLDAQLLYFIIRLLQSSTCFDHRRAHD